MNLSANRKVCNMISLTVCAVIVFTCTLLHSTNCTIYYITPDVDYDDNDDDYSTTANNSITILQLLVDYADEYFTSNTVLQLLPGEHYLNTDSIIQNIDNFSIIGTETDGVINSTIRCTSTAGLSIVNCSNVSLANLRIKDCTNDYNSLVNVFTSWYAGCFEEVGLFLLNSWFVSIINIHLIQDQEMLTCGIKTLNLLGRSMLNNTITNCLELYYDAVDNTTDLLNELYIDNFQREKHDSMSSIAIFLSHAVYNVNIILINSSFSDIQTFLLICDKFLGHTSITISNCNFTMVNMYMEWSCFTLKIASIYLAMHPMK